MMRLLVVSTCTLLATCGVFACDNQTVSPLPGTLGSSGSTSSSDESGGSVSTTATAASGGNASGGITSNSTASGGSTAQGGTSSKTSSGGVSTGGKSAASGGTKAVGGTSSAAGGTLAKGGTSSAVGGTKAMGGTIATGGTKATGGAPTTGGTKATGGAPATGGAKATGGAPATGGTTSSGVTVTKITNGQNGTTTRYWDCCMPSCSWSANASGKSPVKVCNKDGTSFTSESSRNACDGGGGYMCYWGAPWSVSSTVSYGYAAYNGVACGTCFQLDFTGSGINASGLSGKSMIVQAINIGSIGAGQFDLLIPGGGVGAMNACNSNGNMWNGANLGDQYGGLLKSCNNDCSCAKQKCQSVFGSIPTMLAGCNWFTDWFGCADNPGIVYKQISCPSDITSKSGISG